MLVFYGVSTRMNFAGTTAFYKGGVGDGGRTERRANKRNFILTRQKQPRKSRENLVNFGGGCDDILDASQLYTNFARLRSLLNFTFN